MSGTHTFRDVLDLLHLERAPHLYVEVGVRHGRSLQAAACRAIGVDPEPDIQVELPPTATICAMSSDDWFAAGAPEVDPPRADRPQAEPQPVHGQADHGQAGPQPVHLDPGSRCPAHLDPGPGARPMGRGSHCHVPWPAHGTWQ